MSGIGFGSGFGFVLGSYVGILQAGDAIAATAKARVAIKDDGCILSSVFNKCRK